MMRKPRITIDQLKWLTILVPAAFVGIFEFVRHGLWHDAPFWPGNLVAVALAVLGAALLSRFVFDTIARMERRILQQNEELLALNAIATEVNQSLNQREVLRVALDKVLDALGMEAGGIFLLDDRSGELLLANHRGLSEELNQGELRIAPGTGADCGCGEALSKAQPVVIADAQRDSRCVGIISSKTQPHTCITVPVMAKGKMRGALFLVRRGNEPFTQQELSLLEAFSQPIGSAIENARLYEQVTDLAALQERDRIAKEIHDGLAQVLGYLTLKAATVQQLLSSEQNAQAQREVQEMERVAQEAYTDAREAILGLRTTITSGGGLTRSLGEYLHKFIRQSGVQAELVLPQEAHFSFPPTAEVQLLRIIQEALTNIRKHAQAKRARVRFSAVDGMAEITVEDDGQGFEFSKLRDRQGFGLQAMRERAESVRGNLSIESGPGQGTRVKVTLPLSQEETRS